MSKFHKNEIPFLVAIMMAMLLLAIPVVYADHEDGHEGSDDSSEQVDDDNSGPNQHRNRIRNGRSDFHGKLKTRQHIYYPGDTLDIRVKFSRGHDLLADGEADAWIVIFTPDNDVISVSVGSDIGSASRKFFSIEYEDTSTLVAGQYQLALILTIPGGDPGNVSDWFNGFSGLLDVEYIRISEEFLAGDSNLDGEWDEDLDGDGAYGEEEDEDEEHDESDFEDEDEDEGEGESDDSGEDSESDQNDSEED